MQFQPEWDLSSIPDELLRKEWGRRNSYRRQTRKGGKKTKFRKCGFCGGALALSLLRSHVPMCRQTQLKEFLGKKTGLVLGKRSAIVSVVSITRQTICFQAISRPDKVLIPLKDVLEISRKPKRGLSSRPKFLISTDLKARWRNNLNEILK